jgi:NADH:ubiquinone oxidoreductase subunit E
MEKILNKIYRDYHGEVNLISLLHDIQNEFGFIPEDVVDWFSRKLDIPASRFFGIATFYPQFHLKPRGKHTLTICCGAACHIKGSDRIYDAAREILELKGDENTTSNLLFSVQKATCIGACSIAPVVLLNNTVHRTMDSEKITKLLTDYGKDDELFGY